MNEHEVSNVTGIFASDASPKIINDNSVSQNMTTSEPFEEAIIEASREENNGTGAEEIKTSENMLIVEETSIQTEENKKSPLPIVSRLITLPLD